MRFAADTALKNIKKRPLRTAMTGLLVFFLAFSLFAGAFMIISLKKGLASYQARLGADVIVVPNSSKGHGTVDDILLQGITGNYYMSGKDVEKICQTEGIEAVSRQFFLTSAKASCCSVRVQIIGFDPETDFSIRPWIENEYAGQIGDGDLVVGSGINMPTDRQITFYGQSYHVAAQLRRTGTGLDNAVFTNMDTIRDMADHASDLFGSERFKGVDTGSGASALMIKVADGYEISRVTDDINIHVTKVQASSARSMVSDIAAGLGSISRIIGFLVAGIWVMAVVILIIVFVMLAGERRKECAILRIIGASRSMLFRICGCEAVLISAAGALLGLLAGLLAAFPVLHSLKNALQLPFLSPGIAVIALLALATLIICIAAGVCTSFITTRKMIKSETALLLREDA